MFSCEFCEISHNTFFKEPFGRLLLHKRSFCLLSHHDLLFFQKRCHTCFLAEHFLGFIYRLGTRVNLIFQTLRQASIFNSVENLRRSFFSKIVNSLKRWLPTTSILVVIGIIYRYQFKSNYLKNRKFFAAFFLHFWNLH